MPGSSPEAGGGHEERHGGSPDLGGAVQHPWSHEEGASGRGAVGSVGKEHGPLRMLDQRAGDRGLVRLTCRELDVERQTESVHESVDLGGEAPSPECIGRIPCSSPETGGGHEERHEEGAHRLSFHSPCWAQLRNRL